MNLLNLFRPRPVAPKPPAAPFADRLAAVKAGIEEFNDACLAQEKAREALIKLADELYKPYRLIFAEYKGYGIIVHRQYNFDFCVNIITHNKPPALNKDQLYTTQLNFLRPVHWPEVLDQPDFFKWINDHPLAAQIHAVNDGK